MTNTKSTKRALLVSVMAMVICFTMLLGTTFAWFTSEDKVEGNVITAGKLAVDIDGAAIALTNVEPGYVHVHNFTIKNVGTLAFNYKLNLVKTNPSEALGDLAEVIEVYYFLGNTTPDRDSLNGTGEAYLGTLNTVIGGEFFGVHFLDDTNDADTITLVFKMQTTAGNEYQLASLASGFTIQVLAAQRTTETDSLGNGNYDAGATYDE